MERYAVKITEPAQRDLMEIYAYIAQILKVPDSARSIYRALREEMMSLAQMPERYAVLTESPYRDMGMRRVMVKNYMVFYLTDVNARVVTVVRVPYNRREWQMLLL